VDMNEKQKKPRLRYPKDQSAEARATLKKLQDILQSGPPRRKPEDYMPLEEAATLLTCSPPDLLKMGLAGELDIYTPILAEGKYVWPVTEQGIEQSGTVGHSDPVFKTRGARGDYVILPSLAIQDIQQGMDVILDGFIDPEVTLYLIEDWVTQQKNGYVHVGASKAALRSARKIRCFNDKIVAMQDKSVLRSRGGIRKNAQWYVAGQRMRELAKHVPWELADSWVTHPDNPKRIPREALTVRTDMLRVAKNAIQRLWTDTFIQTVPTPCMSAKEKHEKKIEAIEAGADALGFPRMSIPDGGKQDIQDWCQKNRHDLFTNEDSPTPTFIESKFLESWKKARKAERIRMTENDIYASR